MLFDNFFKGFLTPKLNLFLQFSSCNPWRVFGHSNSPLHRALGWYRYMSSSRQIHNYWNFLITALMVEMGIFTALALFLKPLSNLWSSIIFCCMSDIYLFFFSHCDGWLIWNLAFGFHIGQLLSSGQLSDQQSSPWLCSLVNQTERKFWRLGKPLRVFWVD